MSLLLLRVEFIKLFNVKIIDKIILGFYVVFMNVLYFDIYNWLLWEKSIYFGVRVFKYICIYILCEFVWSSVVNIRLDVVWNFCINMIN